MSLFLPRKVKDLPPLEPDSEDDEFITPCKNDVKYKEIGGDIKVNKFKKPKRIVELSPLIDSDDENKTNGFNQAILDDSLTFSPLNSFAVNTTNENEENDQNHINYGNENNDLFELDCFRKLSLNDTAGHKEASITEDGTKTLQQTLVTKTSLAQPKELRQSIFNRIKSSRTVDFSIDENGEHDKQSKKSSLCSPKNNPASITRTNSLRDEFPATTVTSTCSNSTIVSLHRSKSEDIRKTTLNPPNEEQSISLLKKHATEIKPDNIINNNKLPNSTLPSSLSTENSTSKTIVSNFVTPHFKSTQLKNPQYSKQKPLNSITSTQKKSLRHINRDEFQSSKVLFRTPYTVSRPLPITPLPYDSSISLSFDDDSIKYNSKVSSTSNDKNEENNLEMPNRKLSPIKETKNSKKSLNNLFAGKIKKIENFDIYGIDINNDADLYSDEDVDDSNKNIITVNNNEYITYEKLGFGGSSSVYLAKNKTTKKICAIKIVDLKGDKTVIEGYLNETKLLAKLQGNINIITLYEYEHILEKSILYMVMEKGDSDLHKVIQSYKSDLPLYVLINFWHQMLQAVNYIHENGVIHSDLKPSNFLMINGRLKLIDFGIASNISVDSTSIIKYSQAGTLNYISPEALIDTSTGNSPKNKGQPKIKISKKSDVWSLGCILYLLLYKKTPFSHIKNIYAKANAITNSQTEIDYPELLPYYPKILIEMAQKCLVRNPKERLSVAELLLKYKFDMLIPLNKNQQ